MAVLTERLEEKSRRSYKEIAGAEETKTSSTGHSFKNFLLREEIG